MDHRSCIKPERHLTVQDRNIENNDHNNMYQRLKIECCKEVMAKLNLRARLCDPTQPWNLPLFLRLIEAALNAQEKMFPVS